MLQKSMMLKSILLQKLIVAPEVDSTPEVDSAPEVADAPEVAVGSDFDVAPSISDDVLKLIVLQKLIVLRSPGSSKSWWCSRS